MNPILALIITNIIWGAASPIFKFALFNIPPFVLASIRFLGASLIFLPLALSNWQKITLKEFITIILIGFFGVTINISFFFLGLAKTASINAPIIASSGPVFIYFFSLIFLREKPNLKILTGLLISLAGVLFIIFSPIIFDGKQFIFGEIEGNLFFLLATLGAVSQTLLGKKILKIINPVQVSFISFLFGGLTFLPLAQRELSFWSFSSLNYQGWVGIIFGVFLCSALAYYLYYYGISKIKAQEVGLFAYIDPVIAVLIAIPLLSEYPDLYFLIGSFLVFTGIYFAEKRVHYHPFHKLKGL